MDVRPGGFAGDRDAEGEKRNAAQFELCDQPAALGAVRVQGDIDPAVMIEPHLFVSLRRSEGADRQRLPKLAVELVLKLEEGSGRKPRHAHRLWRPLRQALQQLNMPREFLVQLQERFRLGGGGLCREEVVARHHACFVQLFQLARPGGCLLPVSLGVFNADLYVLDGERGRRPGGVAQTPLGLAQLFFRLLQVFAGDGPGRVSLPQTLHALGGPLGLRLRVFSPGYGDSGGAGKRPSK